MTNYHGYQGFEQSAKRKRKRADQLSYMAMSGGPKTLGAGLSQLGTAVLARRADKRADKAERKASSKKQAVAEALMKQMGLTPEQSAMYQVAPGAVIADRMAAPHRKREWDWRESQAAQAQSNADRTFNAQQDRYEDDRTYRSERDTIMDQRYDEGLEYRDNRDAVEDGRYREQTKPKYQFINTEDGVFRGDPITGEVMPMSGGLTPQQPPQAFDYQSPFDGMQLQPISDEGDEPPQLKLPKRLDHVNERLTNQETVRLPGGPMAATGGLGGEVPAINGHVRTGNQYHSGMDQSVPGMDRQGDPTAFDQTLDREAAKTAQEWVSGGQARTMAALNELKSIIKELETTDKNLSGPGVGLLPERFRPKSTDMRQRVESVVQGTLKETLGGQFAKAEADQLFSRAFNDDIQEHYNVNRLRRLYEKSANAAAQIDRMAAYGKQYGTLRGYSGHLQGFNQALGKTPEPNAPGGPSIQMFNQATQTQAPVQIQTAEDYEKLAPGTPFISPDGKRGVKR